MSVCIVIPARLQSHRLPRKMLAEIQGKPLLRYVYESVNKVKSVDAVYIATDSEEIQTVAENFGARVFLTDPKLPSGTARIASIVHQLDYPFMVNVQGDNPLTDPKVVEAVIAELVKDKADVVTPVWPIRQTADLTDPAVVKVARASDGRAVYFSRSPVPFLRDYPIGEWLKKEKYWGHYGIYGYRRSVLEAIAADRLPESRIEQMEKLEQLRFLEAGLSIQTIKTDSREISVDTPEDLEYVRKLIGKMN